MSTMTKVFVVLTTVTAIVLSCLTVATAARWSKSEDTIARYQELYEAELVQRMQAEATLAAGLAVKDDAIKVRDRSIATKESELRRIGDELAQARSDLARVTNEKIAAEAGRKKLEEVLDLQMAELTAAQKQNQELVSQNIDLQTRNQRLASRLLEVTGDLTIRNDQIRNLQERLYAAEEESKSLRQAMATGRRAPTGEDVPDQVVPVTPVAAGPIMGEVSLVDGRYASINVGESSGVVEGMTFMVYRDGTYVGDLEVETVRPKEAGGKITMLASGQQVVTGDRVAYGLEAQ